MIKVTAPARDVRLTPPGHLASISAKQTRVLPDVFRQAAHAAACDVVDHTEVPELDEDRVTQTLAAIQVIMDSGDSALLTTNGEPRATSFTDLLDFKPTNDERAAAWDQFNGA